MLIPPGVPGGSWESIVWGGRRGLFRSAVFSLEKSLGRIPVGHAEHLASRPIDDVVGGRKSVDYILQVDCVELNDAVHSLHLRR